MPNKVGEELGTLEVGSRVGVLVDSSDYLHLYVDGQDKGVVARHVTPPCFAFFNIKYSVTKVRNTSTP